MASRNIEGSMASSLIQYLPTVMREDPAYFGGLLLAFERILGDIGPGAAADLASSAPAADPLDPGLADHIAGIARYLDPAATPFSDRHAGDANAVSAFLDWLSEWVATSLRDDWDVEKKRRFLANAVVLYKKRGTKEGLLELLYNYARGPLNHAFTLTEHPDKPHLVEVKIRQVNLFTPFQGETKEQRNERNSRELASCRQVVRHNKPAHVYVYVNKTDLMRGVHEELRLDPSQGTVAGDAMTLTVAKFDKSGNRKTGVNDNNLLFLHADAGTLHSGVDGRVIDTIDLDKGTVNFVLRYRRSPSGPRAVTVTAYSNSNSLIDASGRYTFT